MLQLFLLLTGNIQAQKLEGKVIDKVTGLPVEDVSIYINKTLSGTISGMDGSFQIPNYKRPYELVFSHINYKTRLININANVNKIDTIKIQPKSYNIRDVYVYSDKERKLLLKHFESAFLGLDYWGEHARIENDSVLSFYVEYMDSNLPLSQRKIKYFEVYASMPVKISMPKLKYTLNYDLNNFVEIYYPEDNNVATLVNGYSYFHDESIEESPNKRITNNRLQAFYNSPHHFLRSLYEKKLSQNGYTVSFQDQDEYFHVLNLDSCNCISYKDNYAIIYGLKDACFSISYEGNNNAPTNLTLANEHGSFIHYSRVCFLKDTVLVKSNGITEDFSVLFTPTIGDKLIGASLPADYKPISWSELKKENEKPE